MVGIIMGSDSDLPIMQEAIDILESFDCLGSKIGKFIQDMKPSVWSDSAK